MNENTPSDVSYLRNLRKFMNGLRRISNYLRFIFAQKPAQTTKIEKGVCRSMLTRSAFDDRDSKQMYMV